MTSNLTSIHWRLTRLHFVWRTRKNGNFKIPIHVDYIKINVSCSFKVGHHIKIRAKLLLRSIYFDVSAWHYLLLIHRGYLINDKTVKLWLNRNWQFFNIAVKTHLKSDFIPVLAKQQLEDAISKQTYFCQPLFEENFTMTPSGWRTLNCRKTTVVFMIPWTFQKSNSFLNTMNVCRLQRKFQIKIVLFAGFSLMTYTKVKIKYT